VGSSELECEWTESHSAGDEQVRKSEDDEGLWSSLMMMMRSLQILNELELATTGIFKLKRVKRG